LSATYIAFLLSLNYVPGVLTLIVPVAEQSKPRKVEVVTAGQPTNAEAVAA
jgi:hypothetical protein